MGSPRWRNTNKEKATMPVLTFSGKTASGEKVQGERVASTKDGLASQLRKERITPGRIREKGKEFSLPTFGSGKVKVKDVAVFFRQFSVMIDAGLPLVQCLEILGANQENPTFQKILLGVRTTVEGGATLANAMRQYPVVFDDLTTNMIEAGETGGILDIILQRLAIYVEKAVKLRAAIKSALIYPVSVVSFASLRVAAITSMPCCSSCLSWESCCARSRSPASLEPWARSLPRAYPFSKVWPLPPAPRATPCSKKR